MTCRGRTLLVIGALALGASSGARAEENDAAMRRVRFHVEASRQVENDRVQAVLGVTDEDTEAARLAGRVNATMTWALERAKGQDGVQVRSGSYSTSPVMDRGKLVRWRASQDLVLEAHGVDALAGLIGVLQERLQVRSISFSVSEDARRETQDALIEEALAAFRRRAALVQNSLGSRDYEIVELQIQTGGGPVRPVAYRSQAMAMAEAAPPALEAGTSKLRVGVAATIELE